MHRLYTLEVEKRGLSAYDNKRYLLEDGVHTLAFGHRDIPAGDVEVGEAPLFPDEHIEARLDIDRAMPPPVRLPLEPLPLDPIDYVLFAARHMERGVPPLPDFTELDFGLMCEMVWDALHHGREATVRERVRDCIAHIADENAFNVAVLSI